jgi:hypothetical protein
MINHGDTEITENTKLKKIERKIEKQPLTAFSQFHLLCGLCVSVVYSCLN